MFGQGLIPSQREQLLHLPVFTAKHNELQEQGQQSEPMNSSEINMLGTIRLPSNLKLMEGNYTAKVWDRPEYVQSIKVL